MEGKLDELLQDVESKINRIRGKCLVQRITPPDFNELDDAVEALIEYLEDNPIAKAQGEK